MIGARSFVTVTLGLFMVLSLAAPSALLNKVLFGLLALCVAMTAIARGGARVRSLSPLVIAAVFLYGFALSFVNETDRALTNQFVLSVSLLFVIYLIDWYQINYPLLVKFAGVCLAIWTLLMIYSMLMAPQSSWGAALLGLFIKYGQGAYGSRSFSGNSLFMFRIGSAPFLFLPYCLFFQSFLKWRRSRDLLAMALIMTVLLITTSRALVLACAAASMLLILQELRWRWRIVTAGAFVIVATWIVVLLATSTSIFSLDDVGNRVKIGHVLSFYEHLTPVNMIFGEGLASYYFSSGYQAYTAHTEVTLLDMARYLGIPLTAVLYAALLFPSLDRKAYFGAGSTHVVIFALYLAVSLTNPVLFNSYGLMVVLWYWSGVLSRSGAARRSAQSSLGDGR